MTLRELVWMAEARQREAWGRTSAVMAMIANVNRGKNTKAFDADDFNPFCERVPDYIGPAQRAWMSGATPLKVKPAPVVGPEGAK